LAWALFACALGASCDRSHESPESAPAQPFSAMPPTLPDANPVLRAVDGPLPPRPSDLGRSDEFPPALGVDPDRPARAPLAPEVPLPPPIDEFEGMPVERELVRFPDGAPSRVSYVLRIKSGSTLDHGPDWRWYDNKGLWIRRTWRQGKQSGSYEEFHTSGYQKFQGNYVDDQRDGEWSQWYETGDPAGVRGWKNGRNDGRTREWYPNGVLKLDATWKDGARDGAWRVFWGNGRPSQFGTYAAEKREGPWKEWNADGRLVAFGSFSGDKENGPWLRVDDHGLRLEENYVAGTLEGLRRTFDAAGLAMAEANYASGKAHGVQREWNPNGVAKSEVEFQNGVQDGRVRYWHPDGRLQVDGRMKAGKREGRWSYWKSDGTLDPEWSGTYEGDKKVSG
jgi:antitoxin component YwqK of YwqJK toxin-antitoxin module